MEPYGTGGRTKSGRESALSRAAVYAEMSRRWAARIVRVTRRQDWRLVCSDNRLSHRGGKYNCTSRAQNKPLVRAGFSQEFGDFGSCPGCLFGLGAVSAAP